MRSGFGPGFRLGLVLVWFATGGAAQEGRSDQIRALFAQVPVSVGLAPRTEVYFGDLAAGAQAVMLARGPLELARNPVLGPVMRAGPAGMTSTLDPSDPGAWKDAAGFEVGEIRAMVEVLNPPRRAAVIALSPGVTAAVPAALAGAGYVPETRPWGQAMTRGEDFGIDIEARNPTDPFGNRMGAASRVAVRGDLLVQANAWEIIDAMATPGTARLTDDAEVAALLAALDSPEAGAGVLVTAMFGLDPLQVVPEGMAVWRRMMLADFAGAAGNSGTILLTFPTRATAEAAGREMVRRWDEATLPSGETFAAMVGSPARVAVTGDGPFVLIFRVDTATPEDIGFALTQTSNLAYGAIWRAIMRREALFLSPG